MIAYIAVAYKHIELSLSQMIDNEVNELLALLSKDKTSDTNTMREIFQRLCPNVLSKRPNEPVTKDMLIGLYNQGVSESNL
jgi:hypothetical protein